MYVCVCVCVPPDSAHRHTGPAPSPAPHALAQRHTLRSELVHVKRPVSDKQDTVFKNQVEKKVR